MSLLHAPFRPVVLLHGDSITQRASEAGGWAVALSTYYQRRADVVNRGFSGYNTRMAVQLLERALPPLPEPPLLATVFFGANDATLPEGTSCVVLSCSAWPAALRRRQQQQPTARSPPHHWAGKVQGRGAASDVLARSLSPFHPSPSPHAGPRSTCRCRSTETISGASWTTCGGWARARSCSSRRRPSTPSRAWPM